MDVRYASRSAFRRGRCFFSRAVTFWPQTIPFEVQEVILTTSSNCRKCIAAVAISDWDHPTLRAVGIVLIATFAALLALKDANSLTAAMGILGGIAGYLFGIKDS